MTDHAVKTDSCQLAVEGIVQDIGLR